MLPGFRHRSTRCNGACSGSARWRHQSCPSARPKTATRSNRLSKKPGKPRLVQNGRPAAGEAHSRGRMPIRAKRIAVPGPSGAQRRRAAVIPASEQPRQRPAPDRRARRSPAAGRLICPPRWETPVLVMGARPRPMPSPAAMVPGRLPQSLHSRRTRRSSSRCPARSGQSADTTSTHRSGARGSCPLAHRRSYARTTVPRAGGVLFS
jgi:hypothetical protein